MVIMLAIIPKRERKIAMAVHAVASTAVKGRTNVKLNRLRSRIVYVQNFGNFDVKMQIYLQVHK